MVCLRASSLASQLTQGSMCTAEPVGAGLSDRRTAAMRPVNIAESHLPNRPSPFFPGPQTAIPAETPGFIACHHWKHLARPLHLPSRQRTLCSPERHT